MAERKVTRKAFAVRLRPSPLISAGERKALERELLDQVEAMGFELNGEFPAFQVCAPGRGLTADEQVAMLDWLIDRPGLVALTMDLPGWARAQGEGCVIEVPVGDLGLIGLTMLYRMRRISAPLYLQILGGFACPTAVH
jgi:hypothetical protein